MTDSNLTTNSDQTTDNNKHRIAIKRRKAIKHRMATKRRKAIKHRMATKQRIASNQAPNGDQTTDSDQTKQNEHIFTLGWDTGIHHLSLLSGAKVNERTAKIITDAIANRRKIASRDTVWGKVRRFPMAAVKQITGMSRTAKFAILGLASTPLLVWGANAAYNAYTVKMAQKKPAVSAPTVPGPLERAEGLPKYDFGHGSR